jgi:hypothetical protein
VTAREILLLQRALAEVSESPAVQRRIAAAIRDAVYAMEMTGAAGLTAPGEAKP